MKIQHAHVVFLELILVLFTFTRVKTPAVPSVMNEFRKLTQPFECYRYVDDNTLIRSLFASERIHGDHKTYTMIDFEYEPKIKYYPTYGWGGSPKLINKPALVIRRFDTFNIYEMFHSLLNTYLVMKMFDLTDVVIVFNDTLGETKLNTEMFSVFTDSPYIYNTKWTEYQFVNGYYEVPLSFTSILTTKTKHGKLRGRGNDHHCKSTLLRGFTEFWKEKKNLHSSPSTHPKVIWSSRGVHMRGNRRYVPSRSIKDESDFIRALEDNAGIPITVVDFGLLSAVESVRVMIDADVLVGVHGAGLMWGAFMRPFDTGIVELFGGDRSATNRHYHNMASLAGVGYVDIRHGLRMVSGSKSLEWSGNKKLVSEISEGIHKFVSNI